MSGKKILSLLMTFILVFSLAACGGGSSVRADEKLVGKYIAVVGEALGISMSGDELGEFSVDLQSSGKGTMTIDGSTENIKWKNDDSTLTLTVEKTDITGTLGTDTFKFEDMLGMGVNITFAKEGTDAADPENYLPEEDKFMLGNWQSTGVTDIIGDPVDMDPYSLFMTFAGDKTVDVKFQGKDLGTFKWSLLGDWGSLDDDGAPDITWDVKDDGIEVSYVIDDEYYIFDCPKGGRIPDSAFSGSSDGEGAEFLGYWMNEYYGWWMILDASGDYADLNGTALDVCGAIYFNDGSDDTGYVYLWDETGDIDDPMCVVDVNFEEGASEAGRMRSTDGYFLDESVGEGDWVVDPAVSTFSEFEHMIEIDGSYGDDTNGFDYVILIRPWGMDWEDIREYNDAFLPYLYDSWYAEAMYGVMPDSMPEE